ncbi:bifunctional precorrin-2 dehydrogenase/sirohydrochlorin ferrochelatase [Desulfosarcina sp.]|uniref:precorrin-2 dehydrogenase/sirohydrochlorin ferrochelatase family protein n=1 Tax=Desulfosarcina sp. TaxID=2027861 RepID=UPI0029B397FA|nr:bifunctional precorrin-2 dehydrogenase/sirohydrochlorin ferrochelatase [Desulfosarcina sp.]MDX2451727.1 bifunctional precorrin-2 dehydrogenase/sirohydrochlorin ferrochelatase [Desulfosarcina sp.]MDX2489514.1 bifunctional precorrin-2 dehydrogenase/sirohydrochlorin ferrochelatase [Desulfosarcina sp.]
MRYYPVNLDIKGRQCLVVGGGRVGSRKVDTLVQCGAVVTVVSAEVSPTVKQLADEKAILLKQRAYRASDVEGMFLVIGATDNETLNRQINADAERLNLLCNIADRPEICNFILPAIVRRGSFVMAISTAGKSPAFAKHVRKRLETQFGPEYGVVLELMGAIRSKLLAGAHEPEVHKPLFEQLIDGDLVALIKDQEIDRIDQLLERVLGPGYRYHQLMPSNQQPQE